MLDLMIVDDEKMVVNDLTNLIDWKANGFNIVALAYNGRIALEKFCRLKPDIVITDVVMPVMKGIELLRKIKEIDPSTIVILISSYSEFAYAKEALALGAFSYLLKDEVTENSLLSVLSKARTQLQSAAAAVNPFSFKSADSPQPSAIQKAYAYMVCEIDPPFPLYEILAKEKGESPVFHKAEIQFLRDVVHDQVSVHNLYMHTSSRLILELYVDRKCVHYSHLNECMMSMARFLLREFKCRFSRSLSVLIIHDRLDSFSAREIFQQYEGNIRNKLFLGPELIIDLTDRRLARQGAYAGFDTAELSALLRRRNLDGLVALIDRNLAEIKAKKDYSGLVTFLEGVLNVIEYFSQETGQSMLKVAARLESSKAVCTFEQCQAWLTGEIVLLLEELSTAEKYSRNVRKAIHFIREKYADKDLGLQSVADEVGLSPTHLGFLFKKETGVTINHFITTVRMESAMEILRSADCKMYEIAESVGYRTSQYFSQVFIRHVGCMPKEYHRLYGKST